MAVVDKSWDGSASRYTDEEWQRACALDRKDCGGANTDAPPKTRCSLPYKEPNGDINSNGVSAAAGRIGQVTGACSSAIDSAKSALRGAYKEMGTPVPDSLGGGDTKPAKKAKKNKTNSAELSELAREFGAKAGVARHGEIAMRWTPDDDTEFRDDVDDDDSDERYIGTLSGHFCVFSRWTEINSFFEGRFMEQIAPGACKKTFAENRNGMRCLMQHGRDPQVGMKPLGPIRELEEDETGGRYKVPMLDTSYNRDLLPALKEVPSLYGASFRFQVMREEVNAEPGRSEHNPDGIEERTITEMKVREFGPVTFPAYDDATAAARSLNDWWLDLDLELFARAHPGAYPERLAELLLKLRDGSIETPPTEELELVVPAAAGTREEAAPPSRAPDSKQGLKSTRLPGAARKPLKTIGNLEEPTWKL